ncbi:uncharacterized protein LOC130926932 isoform X2 [Corythoichthys intestinalis]|uniref:uncharacterized protein LOC130926932 isoform X2 n=1 Tax=Corythoichthys intestinalis TaxID=161448 RepID=UPI0025A630A0|nr:uncharacterized protein LOC130926932 isoform X2 [Corythoichthys intestinalis]
MAHCRLLVYLVCTFSFVSPQVPKYALKGQEINLVPSIFGQPDGILWTRDGKKVVDFNGMEEFVFPPYENRITLDWASAELSIKDARYQDSGEYELAVQIFKKVHRSMYKWEVIDKVGKPSISCKMVDENQATLMCSSHSKHPHLLQFMWHSLGKNRPGPNLTITLQDKLDDRVYHCHVSNPLTNETAGFTAKDCFKDKKTAALLVIILPVIFAVAFMLLIILGCLFRRKLQACFENAKKGVFKRRQSTTEVSGSSHSDETTSFLGGLPTLPSNQRLRPLLPSDWIDSAYGDGEKLETTNDVNKELTADEGVDSGLATSSDPPNSPLTSSDISTSSEQEENSPGQVFGDTSEETVHEGDSSQVVMLSSDSAEEKVSEEEEGEIATQDLISNLVTGEFNKELTADEDVNSGLATSSDPPNSPLTSSDMSISSEQEENSPGQVFGDTSEETVHEGDSSQVVMLSSDSAEEKVSEEAAGETAKQELISNLATGGEDLRKISTLASEGENDDIIADEEKSETEQQRSLTDTNATPSQDS